LFSEPLVGYVHLAHPLAQQAELRIADIAPQDLWLLSEAHCLGQQTRELCRLLAEQDMSCLPFELQIRFESGSLEMLKQMVEHNGGVTLLPALCVSAFPAALPTARIIPCAAPVPSREIGLVSRRAYMKQHLVEAFVRTLLQSLPSTVQTSVAELMGWESRV
jgi:LysR family transcriptional regulator, hydrogen peroxide-inducible genes activator